METKGLRKRVAVYGGTFDPPHYGHLNVAREVLAAGLADEVWLMVSPQNPLKQDRTMSPEGKRLEMTGCLIKNESGIIVSDFEFSLPRPSYTASTLKALTQAFPRYEFIPVVGADNLQSLPRWKSPDEIIRRFGLIVYPRPGIDIANIVDNVFATIRLPQPLIQKVNILRNAPQMDVSSTEIRRLLSAGIPTDNLLPREVACIYGSCR
ncbi:MAG: nicotinate (nicotinamide) nucleotide adenylyltransferase [Muribaculum sp.]|nr:nicotinate (nicotinamide) nucleotide adenylyltransferase [Muribaculum sp.]